MASTTLPSSTSRIRPGHRTDDSLRRQRHRQPDSNRHDRLPAAREHRRLLAGYVDWRGRSRELIADAGASGSVLVVDRDADTLADRRLIAHLAPDEPSGNARLVSSDYVKLAQSGRYSCRALTEDDFVTVPFADDLRDDVYAGAPTCPARSASHGQVDPTGSSA
jgi:hypothetical protein